MGVEFVLGQFEIREIINDKIDLAERYLKSNEEYLEELLETEDDDDYHNKLMISIARKEVRTSMARIKSLKLYVDKVGLGMHRLTLDEIKALETL